jgi:hypothetical protein
MSPIKSVAGSGGDAPNTWCRNLALTQSSGEHALTKNKRLLYQEIATLRFLVDHGVNLLLGAE